jgi:hypothetical protein
LLDCLGRFGSIREIAAAQHMHHSSVAYRLAKIGEILGYDPRTPEGQYRARTALLLWHLHAHLSGRKSSVTPSRPHHEHASVHRERAETAGLASECRRRSSPYALSINPKSP